MNMITAIAYSAGNKAKAINNLGNVVIIQQQPFPSGPKARYLAWLIVEGRVKTHLDFDEQHIPNLLQSNLRQLWNVDPDEDYWQSV